MSSEGRREIKAMRQRLAAAGSILQWALDPFDCAIAIGLNAFSGYLRFEYVPRVNECLSLLLQSA
jgi:hypothetical protein